jgi:hypothetical protein
MINNDAVIWIPKNASSLLRTYDPKRYLCTDYIVNNYIVFLRDPYLRWKSGVSEYFIRHEADGEYILDNIAKIEFDEHTVPQSNFIPFKGKYRYFDLDNGGLIHFNKLYKVWEETVILHASAESSAKMDFMDKIESAVSKHLAKKIKEYYADDYSLITEKL